MLGCMLAHKKFVRVVVHTLLFIVCGSVLVLSSCILMAASTWFAGLCPLTFPMVGTQAAAAAVAAAAAQGIVPESPMQAPP